MGNSGVCGASDNSAGMTGQYQFDELTQKGLIFDLFRGLNHLFPRTPRRIRYSISAVREPSATAILDAVPIHRAMAGSRRSLSSSPIFLTSRLSTTLWHRKTSKSPSGDLALENRDGRLLRSRCESAAVSMCTTTGAGTVASRSSRSFNETRESHTGQSSQSNPRSRRRVAARSDIGVLHSAQTTMRRRVSVPGTARRSRCTRTYSFELEARFFASLVIEEQCQLAAPLFNLA